MLEKRRYIFGILIVSSLLLLTGCSVRKDVRSKEVKEFTKSILESNEKVKDLSFYFIRPYLGGEPTGDLSTGSYYFLEEKIDNQWIPVEMISSEYERAWTDEAWIIPMDDDVEWEVNWKELYGELLAGYYRIGKSIMDFRDTGDYDEETNYANFEVLN